MRLSAEKCAPPDQTQREKALDVKRSILVRAPAGSGKTTLLAERYIRLLAEVDEPKQVVAITFTDAAAAEMRNRVLDRLRAVEPDSVAHCALEHSHRLGWNLLDLPAQLRISTIDSFCRELALQQPLLSGLGGSLEIFEQPCELYRRAARRTLEQIDDGEPSLRDGIVDLLLWRDNNWNDVEAQLVAMLAKRDQWMHDFLLNLDPDWDTLRTRLERPFARIAKSGLTPLRYTDDEWRIVRACFTLLRHAAAELRVIFAETGAADFIEVAQIALHVLKGEDGLPTEAALAVADGIRHLLVDEFQDTSRRQHQLLAHLIAAWPDREGRTCFVVGDPMQSIYSFRNADAELFPRVEQIGLEIPNDLPLQFDPAVLTANFRTAPLLVRRINEAFGQIFAVDDGSAVTYAEAEPSREDAFSDFAPPGPHLVTDSAPRLQLHLEFMPDTIRGSPRSANPDQKARIKAKREAAHQKQTEEIVALIRSHLPHRETARAANEKFRIAVLGRTRRSLAPVAQALREAAVSFRAVELEELKQRPEVLDALALVRALLNPQDRIAWLGLLRAPWCGFSLADLHALVSADSADLLSRPIPDLLAERKCLLSIEGQMAADRILQASEFAGRARFSNPTGSIGTWLEQVWLCLGGAQCVDATARTNLDLLWKSLDNLPRGEADLFGSALDAALDNLTAQPDPDADGDYGVQLMTIHKAKGLEFEVVIVPELQAGTNTGKYEMLSWLERGLPPERHWDNTEEAGEITEFLVAPFQKKGAERGAAKEWVDGVRRAREKQEARRVFYVAATRAREELHLFARPSYKNEADGSLTLCDPPESLLKVAWPGFEAEIRVRFEAWRAQAIVASVSEAPTIESLAASAEDTCEIAPPPPAILRRLPADFRAPLSVLPGVALEAPLLGTGRLYERHEGGLLSRVLGLSVHALLQQFAQLLLAQPWEKAAAALTRSEPSIAAEVRAAGVDAPHARRIAAQALEIALHASSDPIAKWIFAPHPDAANEVRWTGIVDGSLRTVQVDRVFRAGPTPQSGAASAIASSWWIIDYKTAHQEIPDPAVALPTLRRTFAPQIETYAKVLRNLHGVSADVFGGLYYPRMSLFDWWEL